MTEVDINVTIYYDGKPSHGGGGFESMYAARKYVRDELAYLRDPLYSAEINGKPYVPRRNYTYRSGKKP